MFRRSVADMSSIAFILRKSLKNNILELLRHPGKLVAYLFVAACLLFSALSMALSPQEELPEFLDLRILQGIYFALLMFIVMINLIKGVDSGSTFFSMGDVNMLFISPISPKKILVYGLMKQMGMTVLVACCMVAYGGPVLRHHRAGRGDAVRRVHRVAAGLPDFHHPDLQLLQRQPKKKRRRQAPFIRGGSPGAGLCSHDGL